MLLCNVEFCPSVKEMRCHVAEGLSTIKQDELKEDVFIDTNLIQPRWSLGHLFTVMLDVFSILRKTMESLSFWVFLEVALTVAERNGKWRRCE